MKKNLKQPFGCVEWTNLSKSRKYYLEYGDYKTKEVTKKR